MCDWIASSTHHKYILAQFFASLLESCLDQAIFHQLHYYLRPQPVEVNLPLCMTPQKIKPIILLNRSSCCGWSSTHCWWWREHTVALIKSAILGLTQTRKTSSWIFFFSECLPSSRKKCHKTSKERTKRTIVENQTHAWYPHYFWCCQAIQIVLSN